MKWYTLEERPIKKDEEGLFRSLEDGFFYCKVYLKNGKLCLWPRAFSICCNDIDDIEITDIVYWIPLEELKLTLPKDKN